MHYVNVSRIIRSKIDTDDIDIIDQYTVADGLVSVQITDDDRYLAEDLPFQQAANTTYSAIIDRMQEIMILDMRASRPARRSITYTTSSRRLSLPYTDSGSWKGLFHSLKYYIIRDITGYGILHPLMTDDYREDILVSVPARPVYIKHMHHGNRFHSLKYNIMLPTDRDMVTFINRMFLNTGNEPPVAKQGVVTYLPDMSRI